MTKVAIPDDGFGPELTPEEEYAAFLASLPAKLRSRCCSPDEPWVDPDHHDHGHTDCYFMNEAADEIERLRALLAEHHGDIFQVCPICGPIGRD